MLLSTIASLLMGLVMTNLFGAEFKISHLDLHDLSVAALPYAHPELVNLNEGVQDSSGVRMFPYGGRLWNHPVAQAQYGLNNLNSYRITQNVHYLNRAQANAQRIIDTRINYLNAWFFPYRFKFSPLADKNMTLPVPWFSAMAQGQALSLFVRLYQTTHAEKWLTASDNTFNSFLVIPSKDRPWITWIDSQHHLWLEEYPRWPVNRSERVLNGQMFAAFGLYDYWRLTRSFVARWMFDGASTTVEQTFPLFRKAGGVARYSLGHDQHPYPYHGVVIGEYQCLAAITLRPELINIAKTLLTDLKVTVNFRGCLD